MSVLFSAYSKLKVNLRGKYCSLKLRTCFKGGRTCIKGGGANY